MWKTEASRFVRASRESIWQLWTDVERWPRWDDDVEWAKLDGAFVAGTRGKLKPRGGPVTKFEVLSVDPYRSFCDRSYLPLTHLDFTHRLDPADGGVHVTHTITVSGPLGWLFSRIIGRAKLADGLPRAVDKLAALAEGTL
jgi:uncharacterized protein YndB with AHSA1/START domain